MPFELTCFGRMNATKGDCLGILDENLREKLKFPVDINDIHVCRAQDECYILRTTVKTLEEIEDFLKKWTKESRVVWRVNKTCPKRNAAGLKNIYWKEFRCQNSNMKINKASKKIHRKHTNCPAYMGITIKKITSRCRSRDSHLPTYPTIIKINNNHNHLIVHKDYLQNCPVSQETKNKFLKMFHKGHTPLSALNLHRIDLRGEYGESIVFSEMDRSISPDKQWCYRLYASFLANKEKVPEDLVLEEYVKSEHHENESHSVEYLLPDYDAYSEDSFKNLEHDSNSNQLMQNIKCSIENITNDEVVSVKTECISDDAEPSFEQIDYYSYRSVLPPFKTDLSDDQVNQCLSPFIQLMTEKLKSAPELFVPAFEAFNLRLQHFETDLDLSEAIHMFGKR